MSRLYIIKARRFYASILRNVISNEDAIPDDVIRKTLCFRHLKCEHTESESCPMQTPQDAVRVRLLTTENLTKQVLERGETGVRCIASACEAALVTVAGEIVKRQGLEVAS